MTILKTITPAMATVITSALLVSLTGCGMIGSVIEQDRVDYRGAKKAAKRCRKPKRGASNAKKRAYSRCKKAAAKRTQG